MADLAAWAAFRDAPADVLDALEALFRRPAWHRLAACRGVGPGAFFIDRGGDLSTARALCAQCPVAGECAQAGRDEPAGLWAGLAPQQRRPRRSAA